MRHVVWDWNGTLFDDLHIVVASVNASLQAFGGRPIAADDYRTHYTRPVGVFYERLLERPLGPDEWSRIDDAFHASYRNSLHQAGMTKDALLALERVAASGATQSLLSMWWHRELVPMAARLGVDRFMIRVDGNREDAGETKAVHLSRHVAAILADVPGLDQSGFLVIGDTLDDATAAGEVGLSCVLYDGGSHHRGELESVGVPVADSLLDALDLGGIHP